MMTDILTLTGIRLGPGTLYGALARLEFLLASSKPCPQTTAAGPTN